MCVQGRIHGYLRENKSLNFATKIIISYEQSSACNRSLVYITKSQEQIIAKAIRTKQIEALEDALETQSVVGSVLGGWNRRAL